MNAPFQKFNFFFNETLCWNISTQVYTWSSNYHPEVFEIPFQLGF